ncbi:hypothetical protein T12_2270 [Trichinella patagoniensis]|uniref:Uncharacterized protein n=1 Tax=Trichinella patagoniensis TaxID=990121 RepID=A0A0V0ZCY8_9BILA|nr:hypothetical protein T12_2270 [Trichinella patagoniensis]
MLYILGAVGNKIHRKSLSTFSLLRSCTLSIISTQKSVHKGYSACNFTNKLSNSIPSKLSSARMLNCNSMAPSCKSCGRC